MCRVKLRLSPPPLPALSPPHPPPSLKQLGPYLEHAGTGHAQGFEDIGGDMVRGGGRDSHDGHAGVGGLWERVWGKDALVEVCRENGKDGPERSHGHAGHAGNELAQSGWVSLLGKYSVVQCCMKGDAHPDLAQQLVVRPEVMTPGRNAVSLRRSGASGAVSGLTGRRST